MSGKKTPSEADLSRKYWEAKRDQGIKRDFAEFCEGRDPARIRQSAIIFAETYEGDRGPRDQRGLALFVCPEALDLL